MARLIPIFLIIGAIALFIGFVQPTYTGAVADLQAEISELDAALTAAEDFSDKQAELTQQRNAIPADLLRRLESFLPDTVDNVQLIVDLNSLADRSGVALSDFNIEGGTTGVGPAADGSVQPVPEQEGVAIGTGEVTDSLELSVSATGTYAAFRTFLAGVEQSLRPLDVVQLSVDDSDTGVYTYDITFRLYWLR